MSKTLLAALAPLMSFQATPDLVENYEVNLTRKGGNVYKIDGKNTIFLHALAGSSVEVASDGLPELSNYYLPLGTAGVAPAARSW